LYFQPFFAEYQCVTYSCIL